MSKFKDFIYKLLSENNEFPSSKRVIAMVGSFVIFGLTIANPNDLFVDASTIIICGALSITGAISIFKRNNYDKHHQNGQE